MIRFSKPPIEEGGSQPSVTAKTMMSRMPLQKVGMLCAANTRPASRRATKVSRNCANTTPTGIPMPQATSSAPAASCSV